MKQKHLSDETFKRLEVGNKRIVQFREILIGLNQKSSGEIQKEFDSKITNILNSVDVVYMELLEVRNRLSADGVIPWLEKQAQKVLADMERILSKEEEEYARVIKDLENIVKRKDEHAAVQVKYKKRMNIKYSVLKEFKTSYPILPKFNKLQKSLNRLMSLYSRYKELTEDIGDWDDKILNHKKKILSLSNEIDSVVDTFVDKGEYIRLKDNERNTLISNLDNSLFNINKDIKELGSVVYPNEERILAFNNIRKRKELSLKEIECIEPLKTLYGDIEPHGCFVGINDETSFDKWIMELNDRYTNNY